LYASLKRDHTPTIPNGSQMLYGINWDDHFPVELREKNGTVSNRRIVRSSAQEVFDFYGKHYDEIFLRSGQPHPFFVEPMNEQRLRYYEIMGDFLAYVDQDQVVGVFVGNPLDWSTYYLRTSGLLPSHQSLGFTGNMLDVLFPVLRSHGIRRAEVDVAPGNYIEIEYMSKRGFRPTGYHSSDRWGTLLRLCKYLDSQCEETFLNQLCDGPRLIRKE